MQRFLNIGCGGHFIDDPRWVNIDLNVRDPAVRSIDIFRFSKNVEHSASFDGVYLSHVIEHLSSSDALKLLEICRSLLTTSGALRIITPDFDSIVKFYQKDVANEKYDLARAEKLFLLEQCVRSQSSGTLRSELRGLCERNGLLGDYVYHRFGDIMGTRTSDHPRLTESRSGQLTLGSKFLWRARKFKAKLLRFYIRLIRLLVPKKYGGNILTTEPGERHLWVYSSFEIMDMAGDVGYSEIRVASAGNSLKFSPADLRFLELNEDGSIRKGSYSMFIELFR